jgi:hypothetical protein
MAQADSVPSSTRRLITGESANQSTNLPAVRIKASDRSYFINGLDSRDSRGPLAWAHRLFLDNSEAKAAPYRLPRCSGWRLPTPPNLGILSCAWRLLRNVLLVALRFLSRRKRLAFRASENAVEKLRPNQLVRSNRWRG